ncbi:MAG: hypothetical protein AABY64_05675 [Bdellovibrionota bacterium]
MFSPSELFLKAPVTASTLKGLVTLWTEANADLTELMYWDPVNRQARLGKEAPTFGVVHLIALPLLGLMALGFSEEEERVLIPFVLSELEH